MEKRDKKINSLISNLISKCDKHNKELRNRFKVCDIFSSLESRNSSDLQAYISESNLRYQKAKIGGNINSLIKNSNKKLNPLNRYILSNHLYQDFNMDKEKAQLRHKLKHKEAKEINQIMSEIKEFTTYFTEGEKRLRKEFDKSIKEKKRMKALETNTELFTSLNSTIQTNNTKNQTTNSNSLKQTNNNSPQQQTKESFYLDPQNKQIIKDYLYNDIDITGQQIGNYTKSISAMSDKLNDVTLEKKDRIKEIETFASATTNHLNHKLKLLTYTKPVIVPKPKKRHDEIYTEPIDVVKVYRFIKPSKYELARRRYFNKNNNSNLDTNCNTERNDFLDTKQIVKNIAYKSFCFGENIKDKKKGSSDEKKDENYLPQIEEYESIIKDKAGNEIQRRNKYKERYCKCLTEEDTKREILRNKIKDKMKKWNIPMDVLQGI